MSGDAQSWMIRIAPQDDHTRLPAAQASEERQSSDEQGNVVHGVATVAEAVPVRRLGLRAVGEIDLLRRNTMEGSEEVATSSSRMAISS
jgi:hypothetical protein